MKWLKADAGETSALGCARSGRHRLSKRTRRDELAWPQRLAVGIAGDLFEHESQYGKRATKDVMRIPSARAVARFKLNAEARKLAH